MRTISVAFALFAALGTGARAAGQAPLFRHAGGLIRGAERASDLDGVLRHLCAGPASRSTLTSAIPHGTRLVGARRDARTVTLTLSSEFAAALGPDGHLDDALEQIVKTTLQFDGVDRVDVQVQQGTVARPLAELLPSVAMPDRAPRAGGRAPAPGRPGALAGRTIALSPGHGWYWHATLAWTTQRPTLGGLTEDFHTNEIAMRDLIPALENLGARVISVRERGEVLAEAIGDNDQGAPRYAETGAWSLSGSAGYQAGTYRFAGVSLGAETATATWTVPVPSAGRYPVYVFYRGSGNRAPDARYRIAHTGGVAEVFVDQTRDDRRWRHLGDFWFDGEARVVLSNQSAAAGRVVIADAVRVGAGVGSIPRGAGTSGKPRWQEACRYWAEFTGAPSSVFDVPGCSDSCDDVTARPRYAEWRGADAYLSVHTNAGGGTGTSSFIHNTAPTAGSAALQAAVHAQLVGDIRAEYCSSWVDRGLKSANFGEVRELQTMPGVLVEVAFHDQPGSKDHDALHDPAFRRIAGRALARGVLRYFAPGAPLPPTAPARIRVTQDGAWGLRVAWGAAAGATGYAIEQSVDGKGFVEVAQTSATAWSTGPLPHGSTLSFRVRAFNATGRSFPTDVLTAGTSHTGAADLLLVQGFDRLGEFVKRPENTADYLRLHGDAIRRLAEFSLGFDAATNEAVATGAVALSGYRAVDWLAGEESTADESFSSTEQAIVRAYLGGGGRLLVSGAEIGWDLDANGTAADRAFFAEVLGARYLRDDAGTYAFQPAAAGVFAGVPAGAFDDGTGATYNVDYPDVLAPADASSRLALLYSTLEGAAIQRDDGVGRVVYLGFPLETVLDPNLRAALMLRALRFLLDPRPLQAAPEVALGTGLTLDVAVPGEPRAPYALLPSAGLGSLPLGGGHILPLQFDGVLALGLIGSPLFTSFTGVLDAAGRASGVFFAPDLPSLKGLSLYFSGLTANTGGTVQTVLPWARATLR
ncbi:MAG: GerMN domain-containing protein [Planctomycetota bacterium]